MTAAEKKETKQKIIETARILFSKHGFKGTSVRQIADECEVNVAAINYHFGSKEALYWSIIDDVYVWMNNSVLKLIENSKDEKQFARNLFRFMREHRDYATATMKTFLSDQAPPPESDNPHVQNMQCELGPPGAVHVGAFLKKLYPEATDEGLEWMVMCLFSSVFHFAVMTCSVHYDALKKQSMPVDKIESHLVRQAEALANHMANKANWK